MPNSRRRRFSVRNGIASREPCKVQNNLSATVQDLDPDIQPTTQNLVTTKLSKTKTKINANILKDSNNMTMVAQSSSVSVSPMINRRSNIIMNVDKDVTASSSNIDLFNLIHSFDELVELSLDTTEAVDSTLNTPVLQEARERTPLRRDKHPRQHRIKVRSPKRRSEIIDQPNKTNENKLIEVKGNAIRSEIIDKKVIDCKIKDNRSCDTNDKIILHTKHTVSVATEPINWKQEVEEVCQDLAANVSEGSEEERQSDHSLDDMCRICHGGDSLCPELGQLISACACRGTVGRVHVKCLERWLTESGKSRCELCGTRYITRRVHRYGVPRALLMWILSQNAKQLMVDSLGIMLMSPLAVLAAWLSGRTLAGLMTQDSHATPWPLASTFVLACMTLVCYYCWIVSAATRHALGWWIWYRSQYEVRLQLQHDEE